MMVQRRRADIRDYMEADTVFPNREDAEVTYSLTPDYERLFRGVLAYARERVAGFIPHARPGAQAGTPGRAGRVLWRHVKTLTPRVYDLRRRYVQ